MAASIALLAATLGLIVGVLWRECYEILKRLQMAARVLVQRVDKQEKQEKVMTFADPIDWDELDDQERIDLIN